MAVSAPAIFLDKDGTLIEDVPYNVDPALIRLRPGAGVALRRLQAAGFRLIVVSNQSGVARGLFAEEALGTVESRLRALLAGERIALDGFLYCPHHPDGVVPAFARSCDCRKPAPGMLLRAARAFDLHLGRSWLFGDILDDIEAGHRAGCRSVLVDSGGETLWKLTPARTPDAIAPDLLTAAQVALAGPLSPGPFPRRQGERGDVDEGAERCPSTTPAASSANQPAPKLPFPIREGAGG